MKRWIKILSVVLSVQLFIVALYILMQKRPSQGVQAQVLLTLPQDLWQELNVSSQEKQLKVVKKDNQWMLPEYFDAPASQTKVESFLQQLSLAPLNWPVATTQSALKRFKVDEHVFERKLTLVSKQGQKETLYLGTSPSFKKVHARLQNDGNIYSIPLNSFEASIKPEDWVDHALLYVSENQLQSIQLPQFGIEKSGDEFHIKNETNTFKMDPAKVKSFVFKITHLSFQSLLGNSQPALLVEEPLLNVKIQTTDASDPIEFQFFPSKEGDHYILKTSKYGYYFKMTKTFIDELKAIKLEQLKLASEPSGDNALEIIDES